MPFLFPEQSSGLKGQSDFDLLHDHTLMVEKRLYKGCPFKLVFIPIYLFLKKKKKKGCVHFLIADSTL